MSSASFAMQVESHFREKLARLSFTQRQSTDNWEVLFQGPSCNVRFNRDKGQIDVCMAERSSDVWIPLAFIAEYFDPASGYESGAYSSDKELNSHMTAELENAASALFGPCMPIFSANSHIWRELRDAARRNQMAFLRDLRESFPPGTLPNSLFDDDGRDGR